MADTPKVVHQLRRARLLAAEVAIFPSDTAETLDELAPRIDWERVAKAAGIRKPSADTIALAVELLSWRTEERQPTEVGQ